MSETRSTEGLAIRDVVKTFPTMDRPALSGVDAEARPGRITGLVGPDGAGKTTLLRIIAGLLAPDEGTVAIFGADVHAEREQVRHMLGYMPQQFGLYEDLSVMENMRLYADLRGTARSELDDVFSRLLDFTGLSPFTDRLAGRLSGGMKQKLGLACSLIKKPRLLLLDEPSVGVDPISRRELWRMVRELVDEEMVVLWSTAYLDEAEQCDHVLLLNRGELLYTGPPKELTDRVEGRVVQVRGIAEDRRRRVLADCLRQDAVMDGVVQGSALRLLLREGETVETDGDGVDAPDLGDEVEVVRVEPRFEDAFMNELGGGPGGDSKLAERFAAKQGGDGPVVEAEGLTKRFGDFTAVQDNNFSIRPGEIYGLLGPNGAGKSTTFKMLCGLLTPTEGNGTVAGYDLGKAAAKARSRLGYMAQKFSLYGDLSVSQNLDFFSGVYGLRGRKRRQARDAMVEIFSMEQYLDHAAKGLPLGYKQRLALSCAVMHEPAVLFLDEPTSGVDPVTRREFWAHINGLVEKGVAVLVTTHFMDEAEYCDRIGLIYKGQKIADDTPDGLKQAARTDETPDPTLEEAFIAMVEKRELNDEDGRAQKEAA